MKIEESFGEDFEKRMEAWGERFGKVIEFHVKRHSKDVERWATELSEELTNSMDIEVIVEEAMAAKADAEHSRICNGKSRTYSQTKTKGSKVFIKRLPTKSTLPKHSKELISNYQKASNLNVKYGQVIYAKC